METVDGVAATQGIYIEFTKQELIDLNDAALERHLDPLFMMRQAVLDDIAR